MYNVTKKLILILAGFMLAFILLEAGLQFSGFVLTIHKDFKNSRNVGKENQYTILCLGESTTQDQYPPFLEEELNKRNLGVTFKVIDEGKRSCTTDYILANLEFNIEKYKPNMIIAMMGINDANSDVVFEYLPGKPGYRKLKSYKLLRLVLAHGKSKFYELQGRKNPESPKDAAIKAHQSRSYQYTHDTWAMAGPQVRKNTEALRTIIHEDLQRENVYADILIQYLGQVDEEEIKRFCVNKIQKEPKRRWAYIYLGEYYLQKKNYKNAVRVAKEMIEQNPNDAYGYFLLGKCYADERQYRDAEETILRGLALDPVNKWGYLALKSVYEKQKRFSRVDEIFHTLIQLNPLDEWVNYSMGTYYRNRGKTLEAEKAFQRAITANAKHRFAYQALKDLYQGSKRYKDIDLLLSQALQHKIFDDLEYVKLGDLYMQLGRYEDAEIIYNKALIINPDSVMANICLGNMYCKSGRFIDAKNRFSKVLQKDPQNGLGHIGMGDVYVLMSNYVEAEKSYKRGLTIHPEIAWIKLGTLHTMQGRYSEAESMFYEAISANPEDEEAYIKLTLLYKSRKMNEKAEQLLKKSIEKQRLKSTVDVMQNPTVNVKTMPGQGQYDGNSVNLITQHNYERLKKIAQNNSIVLVCMQYPTVPLNMLKKLFQSCNGVLFVDNEESFISAINKEGFNEYFVDRFGGSFGHCTHKGNRLLAKNIADTIMQEIDLFKKRNSQASQ